MQQKFNHPRIAACFVMLPFLNKVIWESKHKSAHRQKQIEWFQICWNIYFGCVTILVNNLLVLQQSFIAFLNAAASPSGMTALKSLAVDHKCIIFDCATLIQKTGCCNNVKMCKFEKSASLWQRQNLQIMCHSFCNRSKKTIDSSGPTNADNKKKPQHVGS